MASAGFPRLLNLRCLSTTLGRTSLSSTAATFRTCRRSLVAVSNSQRWWNTAGSGLSAVPRVPTSAALGLVIQRWSSGVALTVQELEDQVLSVLKMFDKVKPGQVTLEAHFINDLGMDSLDAVEVVMAFEDEFGCEISDEEAEKIFSAKDAVELLKTKIDMH